MGSLSRKGVKGMKQYKVEMIISTHDILDEWVSDDIALSIKEDMDFNTYGQIEVVEVQVEEVAE